MTVSGTEASCQAPLPVPLPNLPRQVASSGGDDREATFFGDVSHKAL